MSELEKKEKPEDAGSEDDDYDPEAQVVATEWKACDLPEVPVVTGEEDDEVIIKMRSKIYRWRKQWKERGIGELKILKSKSTNLQRILVRAEKTHKCIVNHFLQKKDIFCQLQQMKTSNNAWSWAGYDISDEKAETQKFCAKFTSKEDFQNFKVAFDKACEDNAVIFEQMKKEEGEKKQQ